MNRVSVFRLACMLAALLFAPLTWGADCSVPIQLPDRPQIDQFADYSTFLVEAMEYKTKKREQAEHKQKCPQAYVEKQRPNPDPTKIEGPETLSDALQRARKIPRIDYSRHQKWYDRTTSRSFPLPDLGGDQLSSNTIETSLKKMRYKPDPEPPAGTGDQQRERVARGRDDDMPLQGSDWLPNIYNREFSATWLNGEEGQMDFWLFLESWLPGLENEVGNAAANRGFIARLASIETVESSEGARLQIYLGGDGNPFKSISAVHFETCLSSCL